MTLVVAPVQKSRICRWQNLIRPLECVLQSHPGSQVRFMSEVVSSKPPKEGRRWLSINSRILVTLFMLLAVLDSF